MKNVYRLSIFAILFFSLSLSTSFAQEFKKGTKLLSLGLGAGGWHYGLGVQSNIDVGITDKIGIGYIGVGALVGFSGSKHDYNYFYAPNYSFHYFNAVVAARATYHFDLGIDKLDLYGGVLVGLNFQSGTFKGPSGYGIKESSSNVGAVVGPFAGARYMFTDKFGAYGELAAVSNFSIISIGGTIKF